MSRASREFHLGEFVRVLEDTAWLGFSVEITKAHRSAAGTDDLDEVALRADRGADVIGFRFDQPFTVHGETRTLDDYDMALFFPIDVGEPDLTSEELASEASAVASFMEHGGGFFATGDHQNLGAYLCGLIPRVRSMRRWWQSTGPDGQPAAPSATYSDRHDTTQAGPDGQRHFEDQSDDVAQPIDPLIYDGGPAVVHGYPATRRYPHPLLCSPDGMISYLPDHMHEGWCEVPDALAARTFTLDGTTVREYPDYTPSSGLAGDASSPLEPEVVAVGHVVAGTTSPALDEAAHSGGEDPTVGKTFGVIGAWDGHRVGKGRVVVDSTWHHFFDINLTGDRYLEDEDLEEQHKQKLHGFFVEDDKGNRVPSEHYRAIKWYFRNIVYWLIPATRIPGISWSTIDQLTKRPRFVEELATLAGSRNFDHLSLGDYLYFGHIAEDYLRRARGHCSTFEIHKYIYRPRIPWQEWIQREIDIWAPAQRDLREGDGLSHLTGALGAGPRLDVAPTLSLGAALVAVAFTHQRNVAKGSSRRGLEDAPDAWPAVLNHALSRFSEQLAIGVKSARTLQKVITSHMQATSETDRAHGRDHRATSVDG